SFIASRSSFLIGELLLGKLSETVVVQGNARMIARVPRESSDRQPCEFPLHEIANAQDPRNELSARHHSISLTEQPRQLLFFGQTCASLGKLSDKQRCDPRVNEYTA